MRELATEWSKLWRDEVTEDDVLSYAADGSLELHALISHQKCDVLNREEIKRDPNIIAPDGTTFLFKSYAQIDDKKATVILQKGVYSLKELYVDGMTLQPISGSFDVSKNDIYVLREEKKRFEKSQSTSAPAISDNSLIATIAALLASFPKGKQPTGKELEKAASSIGVAISDDTIRKALKAARELAPSLPPA